MTPKEKAKGLIELFTFNCRECDNVKLSALIAVDEIIHYLEIVLGVDKEDFKFWQQIRQEIQAL